MFKSRSTQQTQEHQVGKQIMSNLCTYQCLYALNKYIFVPVCFFRSRTTCPLSPITACRQEGNITSQTKIIWNETFLADADNTFKQHEPDTVQSIIHILTFNSYIQSDIRFRVNWPSPGVRFCITLIDAPLNTGSHPVFGRGPDWWPNNNFGLFVVFYRVSEL